MDPFSKFFYQQIRENILYVYTQGLPPDLQYVTILPCESWKSKNITDFDSILSKLLTCSWGHFEHLIYHLTVVKTDCLKTADIQDCWHWVTDEHSEVCQTTSRINSWMLFSWMSLHHGDFFTMIIFTPSSFCLRYTSCVIHIFK